jgi:hypothetical protein
MRTPAQVKFFVWVTNRMARSDNAADLASSLIAFNRFLTNAEILSSPLGRRRAFC